MAWLDDQIQDRSNEDRASFQEAMEALRASVTGETGAVGNSAAEQAQTAISCILAYYGAIPSAPLSDETSVTKLLEHNLISTGIMYREVSLPDTWYKDAIGCLMGLRTDGVPVALLPSNRGGYVYLDPETGKKLRVTKQTMDSFLTSTAYCFYKPLPNKKLSMRDLMRYMVSCLDRKDIFFILVAALFVAFVGLLLPALNHFIYGPVLEAGTLSLVVPIGIILLSITMAQLLINTARSAVLANIDVKLRVNIEAAVMMRLLDLPPMFFKRYNSGDLASRVTSIQMVITQIEEVLLGSSLTSLFSLIYLIQLFFFAPAMVIPALVAILATCAANLVVALLTVKRTKEILELKNKNSALNFSIIDAIQKVKLAGAERRIFSLWAKDYARVADLQFGHPGVLFLSAPVTVLVSAAGLVLVYFSAINGGVVDVADYMAFTSVYGMVTAAFTTLNASLTSMLSVKPYMEQLEPILSEVPESGSEKQRVEKIRGAVSLQNITFAYPGMNRPLFEELSLDIKSGEHVAIVGTTGCGKSTIMRLMLGFEKPSVGSVFYDSRDLSQLDADSLRSHIGVVLQNSTLFPGSIFHNIAIASSDLTMERAWELCEMVGIADDIHRMPMGLMTMVSENGGGLSGGQRQRIVIARALASNPKILMFDEATSALDNISQRQVTETLDSLKCTRIVIAHRLSTIRHCDRIIVIDKGKIVEEGTYEELVAQDGLFRGLTERQRL